MVVRYRWTILAVGTAAQAAFSAVRQGMPSLGPALRTQFALSLTQVGAALASVSLGILLTLLAWGALADRVGERPVLAAGLAGTALALVAAAFAPTYPAILAALVATGMLGASATGASGRAVMGWFGRRERGFALGVRQTAVPVGGGVAALTLPLLVAAGGLRAALLTLSGVCVIAALAAWRWVREAPPAPANRPVVDAPAPVRDGRIWRLGAGSALLVCAQSALLGFVVLFLHDERGWGVAQAALVLAAMYAGGAVARIAGGRWSDRLELRVAPLRRLAGAGAALLAAHRSRRAWRPGPGARAAARRHRCAGRELERAVLHRRGRDVGARARRDRDGPAEHPAHSSRGRHPARLRRPGHRHLVAGGLRAADPLPARRAGRARSASRRGARPARRARTASTRTCHSFRHPVLGDLRRMTTTTSPAPERDPDVQSGLEGVVAFATEIAEPDKAGSALRYRGVDIEDLVGKVPYEKVWGLLVDGSYDPGLPPAEPHPLNWRSGDPRVDVQAALAQLAPEWGLEQLIDISDERARDDLARASVMSLSFVAQSARGIGQPPVPQREVDQATHDPRALPHPLARRGRPGPREGDRRVLDQRSRARDERVDLHRSRGGVHGRGRGRRALRGGRCPLGPAARRRAVARAQDARRRRAVGRRRGATSRSCWTPVSG